MALLQLVEFLLVLLDIGHDDGRGEGTEGNGALGIETDHLQLLLYLLGQPDGKALLIEPLVLGDILLQRLDRKSVV